MLKIKGKIKSKNYTLASMLICRNNPSNITILARPLCLFQIFSWYYLNSFTRETKRKSIQVIINDDDVLLTFSTLKIIYHDYFLRFIRSGADATFNSEAYSILTGLSFPRFDLLRSYKWILRLNYPLIFLYRICLLSSCDTKD